MSFDENHIQASMLRCFLSQNTCFSRVSIGGSKKVFNWDIEVHYISLIFILHRYYVQLPTEKAHDYHEELASKYSSAEPTVTIPPVMEEVPGTAGAHGSETANETRIHPAVLEKIRQMVAAGERKLYTIRKQLR